MKPVHNQKPVVEASGLKCTQKICVEKFAVKNKILYFSITMGLSRKHKKTINAIFANPVRSNILWSDIEKLLVALGAEISEGRGSRIRVALNKIRAVFHRPHPRKETDKGALKSMRRFLTEAGIKPYDET